MNNKYLTYAVIILILVSTVVYVYWPEQPKKGSKKNPYMIKDVEDLQDIDEDLDAHYALSKDIDANETEGWNGGKGFEPIGVKLLDGFTGSLDGRGHVITGLYINRTGSSSVGLFGHLGHGGKITDLGLIDSFVKGKKNVGVLAGVQDYSKVKNCFSEGEVIGGEANTGGLIGRCDHGNVYDSYSDIEVTGEYNTGGLVGYNIDGRIENSYSSGDVDGENNIGGLNGYNREGHVKNSYSKGDVYGDSMIGGFIGYNYRGVVIDSYSKGDVVGNRSVGGFVGYNTGRLMNSHYNMAEVDVSGERMNTLCGYTDEEFTRWMKSDMGKDIDFEGGSGTEDDPYLIEDLEQLQAVRNDLSAHYELINDINASETEGWNAGEGFRIIGKDEPFKGTFDGRDNKIEGLYIHRRSLGYSEDVGLFGIIGEKGKVRNVILKDVNVKGGPFVGALAGRNCGSITYSYATGYIRASSGTFTFAGGLAGSNSGMVSNSRFADGEVMGGNYVGGLVGIKKEGMIENSYYNIDSVKVNGKNRITSYGLFENQYNEWLSNFMDLDISDYSDTLVPKGGFYEIHSVYGFMDLLGFARDEKYKFSLKTDLYFSERFSVHIPHFESEFYGNNHTIYGLDIDIDRRTDIGLFGYVGNDGKISDLRVEDAEIDGKGHVGILVGTNKGTVKNSYVEGSISGNDADLGGLVGVNKGVVDDSESFVYVKGSNGVSGGLVGLNNGDILDSHSDGILVGGYRAGGLVGKNTGKVERCYSSCDVDGKDRVGGLMGEGYGKIIDSYASGDVNGTDAIGGLVGYNYEQVVKNCYSTGEVHGDNKVGGLIGNKMENPNHPDDQRDTYVENCFWDPVKSGIYESEGGTGKTTEEMKKIETYEDAGWDIIKVDSVYDIDENHTWNIVEGKTYPFLS